MTTRFVSAAELMGRVLGMPDYAFSVIEHPVSSAADARLRDLAAITLDDVRRLLLSP